MILLLVKALILSTLELILQHIGYLMVTLLPLCLRGSQVTERIIEYCINDPCRLKTCMLAVECALGLCLI